MNAKPISVRANPDRVVNGAPLKWRHPVTGERVGNDPVMLRANDPDVVRGLKTKDLVVVTKSKDSKKGAGE